MNRGSAPLGRIRDREKPLLWSLSVAIVLSLSLLVYIRAALNPAQLAMPSTHFFLVTLLPLAMLHLFGLLCVRLLLGPGNRNLALYWAASIIVILVAGGLAAMSAFLGLLLLGAVLAAIGGWVAELVFPEEVRSWGLSLGLGIVAASVLGSGLAVLRLFTIWAAVPLLVLLAVLSMRGRWRTTLQRFFSRASSWNRGSMAASEGIAIEGMFLLSVFVWVGASAPEIRSDALRVYLPYVRLLQHFHGFFSMPTQAAFILPQAGMTYAGLVHLILGPRAVRYAMPLALGAIVGIVTAKGRGERSGAGLSVALVVASCPLILAMTLSLMQEAFVSLAIVVLGLACVEGRLDSRPRFWIAVGALAGAACMAKYTNVVYVAPLALWGTGRSLRRWGFGPTVRGCASAGIAGAAVGAPWLWNAYGQSGDPLFPFFLKLMHSRAWPMPLGKGNLDLFRLSPGPLGWISWPYDFIAHTNKFVEGLPGYLGIAVPLLLILAVPVVFRARSAAAAAWILGAAAGTLALWTQTVYLRYWLPGLWMLAIPAVGAVAVLARSEASRRTVALTGLMILFLQIPAEMKTAWKGWPWRFYAGALDEECAKYEVPGYGALHELELADPGWPRIWFSGFAPVGLVRVIPQEAAMWQFTLRGIAPSDRAATARELDSAGCDYWVVNDSGKLGNPFRRTGVAARYWTAENLILTDGPIEVYRMPNSQRASAVTSLLRRRALRFQADLLTNRDFRESTGGRLNAWKQTGDVRVISPTEAGTEGAILRLGAGASLWQAVTLPAGRREFQLTEWARAAPGRSPLPYRLQVNWLDSGGDLLNASIQIVSPERDWGKYQMIACMPRGARVALVDLTSQDPGAVTDVRDVRFCAASGP